MARDTVLFMLVLSVFVKTSISVVILPRLPSKWEIRVNATLQLIRSRPCLVLQKPNGCTDAGFISRIPTDKMNVYTAEEGASGGLLKTVLPGKRSRSLTRAGTNFHPAVIVIDPYPTASFGHLVLIFFVDSGAGVHNSSCRKNRGIFTDNRECITTARKKHCSNRIAPGHRRKCEINFIPLVYSQNDSSKSQKLHCTDQISGFAKCPKPVNLKPENCENKPKCSAVSPDIPAMCTYDRCDHAVLVSGGWTAQTIHPRFSENLERFHRFLLSNDFKSKNVVTFYAQRAGFEPSNANQKSFPARDKNAVGNYISGVCNDRLATCVDSLVVYLTGPATNTGSLLFWDNNADGLIKDNEIYTPTELLLDLKNCTAKRVVIVADHSYSGMLVERLKSKALHSHWKQFAKIAVLTSSSLYEASWPGTFTDSFITHSKPVSRTKSVGRAFEGVKKDFQRQNMRSTPSLFEISSGSVTNLTIYGGRPHLAWCADCSKTKASDSGCTLLKISQLWPKGLHPAS